MNLSAVILAGGQSTRMGRDKAWLEIDRQSLIVRAANTIRALDIKELFISGRAGVDYSSLGCPVLPDLEPGLGPLAGIERALEALEAGLLLVLAVDLPGMTAPFLRQLATRCTPLTGVVPMLGGDLEPLAAIYPKRCHTIAADALARGRRAAKDFALACLKEKAARPFVVAPSDAGCFANWNRPSDVLTGTVGAHKGMHAPGEFDAALVRSPPEGPRLDG